jgi:hypothetical protein
MAAATVVMCNEVSERSGDRDQNSNHRYQREFQVITSDATAGTGTVLDYIQANVANFSDINTGTPVSVYEEFDLALGALVYTDVDSVCVSMSARQNDKNDLQNWIVTVYYVGLQDPTLEPAEIDSGDTKWQEAMIRDESVDPVTGLPAPVPCCNSAGDPIDGGILRDRTRTTLVIVKNIPWEMWDPVVAAGYKDTLNDYLFGLTWFPTGFPIGTVKLSSLTAKRIQRTDQLSFYAQRRAFFEIDPHGWNAFVRDAGYFALDPTTGIKDAIRFPRTGVPASYPILLDGAGHLLNSNWIPNFTTTPPVVFPATGFVRYRQADWTQLNLETP